VTYVKWELPHQRKEPGCLEFFEYSNNWEYTVIPDVVEYDKKELPSQCMTSFLVATP
jgi:hypothetical protein